MSYCKQCYKKLAYNTVYCYHCGTKNKIRKKVAREVRKQPKQGTDGLWTTIFNFIFAKKTSA